MISSFKAFLERHLVKPTFFGTNQDELGVKPGSFVNLPQWAASVGTDGGEFKQNGVMYQIVNIVKDNGKLKGAMVKMMDVDPLRKTVNDDGMRVQKKLNTKPFFVSAEKLNGFFTQGADQPAPAGGGAGGLPGGF